MDDAKKEIKDIIDKCNDKEMIDYLYKWIVYSINYYQQEKPE